MHATSNQQKMQAAVAGWIRTAANRNDGPALLEKKAAWVETQLRKLSKASAKGGDLPEHLEGLTAFDLSGAQGDLLAAAARQRAQQAAVIARYRAVVGADQAAA